MKAMLLRVGIDKGTDGCLSPIFEDLSFEYIPLSETEINLKEKQTFSEYMGKKGKLISEYLPQKVKDLPMHLDPEFESFTYGDKGTKAKWLLKLNKNDFLVFYAGLNPYGTQSIDDALYLIGYFKVSDIINFDELSGDKKEKYSLKYFNNAHLKRHNDLEGLVIAKGYENQSKLLNKAIIISEPRLNKISRRYHAVSYEMENLLGIKGSIQRSIPPRIIEDEECIRNLMKILGIN